MQFRFLIFPFVNQVNTFVYHVNIKKYINRYVYLSFTVYYAKIGGFLCYIAPFLIVLFNDKMLNLILPVFNSAVLLQGLTLFDIYGMKGMRSFIIPFINTNKSEIYKKNLQKSI